MLLARGRARMRRPPPWLEDPLTENQHFEIIVRVLQASLLCIVPQLLMFRRW